MNLNPSKDPQPERRVSLEQKIRRLARQYRRAEKRRRSREEKSACHSRRPRRCLRIIAFALNLLPLALVAGNASVNRTFEQALEASASGHFDKAVAAYQTILAEQGNSASVLYNLGNAFYHQNRWGRAILNYQRALWLSPRDPDAAANLRLAQHQAGLPVSTPGRLEAAARFVNANTTAWIGGWALLVLAVTLVLRTQPGSAGRTLSRAALIGSSAVLLLALAVLGYWWTRLDQAVILSAGTPVRLAPASASATACELHEGQMVSAGEVHGDFMRVRTADGHQGWVNRGRVARIVSEQSAGNRGQQG